jgi:hypothetical protein
MREQLTANRTYYVASSGSSDSNNGLSVGSPFATIQKAVDVICNTLDCGGYNVTVQIADGTYGPFIVKPVIGSGEFTIQGNSGATQNVVVSSSSAQHAIVGGFSQNTLYYGMPVAWTIKYVKVIATGGIGVLAIGNSILTLVSVNFGTCLYGHIYATLCAAIRVKLGNYTISGGAGGHIIAADTSVISFEGGTTVTLTGTPAFTYFADASRLGAITTPGVTFSGAATGTRYIVSLNAIVQTGAGANHYPGSVAGSTSTGGQYV